MRWGLWASVFDIIIRSMTSVSLAWVVLWEFWYLHLRAMTSGRAFLANIASALFYYPFEGIDATAYPGCQIAYSKPFSILSDIRRHRVVDGNSIVLLNTFLMPSFGYPLSFLPSAKLNWIYLGCRIQFTDTNFHSWFYRMRVDIWWLPFSLTVLLDSRLFSNQNVQTAISSNGF